jgi:glyoxylase-like metal-dependent hydrolase (beta-lactamase superfamily II)
MVSRAFVVATALVCMSVPAWAQNWDEVEIEAIHVAGKVWALKGAGGNIGASVGEDGVLLVDDQYAPLTEKIDAKLQEIGGGELRFVLNTHYHGDHTGGNVYFGEQAPIIAHENVRVRLSTPQTLRGNETEPLPKVGLPVITYEDGLSIHLNGEEVRVFHLPNAHTDGDSVVWFTESNVVHMGDLLFYDHFPFVDLEHGGSVDGLLKGLDRVLERVPEDAKVIAGHFGPAVTLSEVREFRDMVADTTEIVRERMEQGASLEEIKEAGLPEEYADWSWRFISTETWIETIHDSTEG